MEFEINHIEICKNETLDKSKKNKNPQLRKSLGDWAKSYAKANKSLAKDIDDKAENVISELAQRDGLIPLKKELNQTTKKNYIGIAKNQKMNFFLKPQHLIKSANKYRRSSWWSLKAVVIRQYIYAYKTALINKQNKLAKIINEGIKKLDLFSYSLFNKIKIKKTNKQYKYSLNEEIYKKLLKKISCDKLRKSIIILKHTGIRPFELKNGVSILREKDHVIIKINGAKKYDGIKNSDHRFMAKRGRDRVIISTSEELQEIGESEFKFPQLSDRFFRFRKNNPEFKNISLYSFRNYFMDNLENNNKEKIAYYMGHQSTYSQRFYGKNS